MAHNTRIRFPGTWTLTSVLTPGEIDTLDQRQFEAINGDLGGTWAPTDPIIIGGDGLQVTGPLTVSGALTSSGTTAFSGAMTVTGAATFDDITVSGTNHYKLASRGLVRVQPWAVYDGSTGAVIPHATGNLTNGATIRHYVVAPHGCTITAATVFINPPDDGVLPGTKPTVNLVKYDVTTGTASIVTATTTDPAASVGAYEAHHGFGFTGETVVVNRTTSFYYLQIAGESGANATAIFYAGCYLVYTTGNIDDGY